MLNPEIMDRYNLVKDWRNAGFHGTDNHRQIAGSVRIGLGSGRLIAITGPIGVGKTLFLHRPQDAIASERKVIVAESLAVDAARTTVTTLIAALFYDLSREKEVKIPAQGERRERELRKLVQRAGKPVALFVDEAHDLHSRTLNGLKRLMEVIGRGGGNLSVVLVGHPKLRNDLRRPTMEEIGHRTDVLTFEGLGNDGRPYLDWLISECLADDTEIDTVIEAEALELMTQRLHTPLQFAEHLSRAFEEGLRTGQRPLTTDIVEATLAPDFDDLEPRLTRQGYSVKVLAEQFHAKPMEIRRFLNANLRLAVPANLPTKCGLQVCRYEIYAHFIADGLSLNKVGPSQILWSHSQIIWAESEL